MVTETVFAPSNPIPVSDTEDISANQRGNSLNMGMRPGGLFQGGPSAVPGQPLTEKHPNPPGRLLQKLVPVQPKSFDSPRFFVGGGMAPKLDRSEFAQLNAGRISTAVFHDTPDVTFGRIPTDLPGQIADRISFSLASDQERVFAVPSSRKYRGINPAAVPLTSPGVQRKFFQATELPRSVNIFKIMPFFSMLIGGRPTLPGVPEDGAKPVTDEGADRYADANTDWLFLPPTIPARSVNSIGGPETFSGPRSMLPAADDDGVLPVPLPGTEGASMLNSMASPILPTVSESQQDLLPLMPSDELLTSDKRTDPTTSQPVSYGIRADGDDPTRLPGNTMISDMLLPEDPPSEELHPTRDRPRRTSRNDLLPRVWMASGMVAGSLPTKLPAATDGKGYSSAAELSTGPHVSLRYPLMASGTASRASGSLSVLLKPVRVLQEDDSAGSEDYPGLDVRNRRKSAANGRMACREWELCKAVQAGYFPYSTLSGQSETL